MSERVKPKTAPISYREYSGLYRIEEPPWNLGRNAKKALPKLKSIGDQSAHNRRYNAHREDIDKLSTDFRNVCQELLYLAGLK